MPKSITGSFYLVFLVATTVFLLIGFGLNAVVAAKLKFPMHYLLGLFFAIVTFLVMYGLLSGTNGQPAAFVRRFMAGSAVKLMVYILVLAFALVLGVQNPAGLITFFLLYYVLFTVFEVIVLQRSLTPSGNQ